METKNVETKNVTASISKLSVKISKGCIICDEPVVLTELEEAVLRSGHHIDSKVCDKCRQAILRMRNQTEKVGKWKLHPDGSGTCDQCNYTSKDVYDMDNYQQHCGHCGSKMSI